MLPATSSAFDRDAAIAGLRRFLDLLLAGTRLELRYDFREPEHGADDVENPDVLVVFRGRDEELLLERNAELLHAIEYIALRWLHLPPPLHDRIRLDCAEWRAMRLEELKLAAQVAADRVRETHQPFRFNPMSARERRVIHLALHGASGVRTASEGAGDDRHVVVYPADAR